MGKMKIKLVIIYQQNNLNQAYNIKGTENQALKIMNVMIGENLNILINNKNTESNLQVLNPILKLHEKDDLKFL